MKKRFPFAGYVKLMKPSIMLLVLLTGAASLVMEGSILRLPFPHSLTRFCLVLLGLLLAGGSANAFNMYFERDVDALMERTRNRRPLPAGVLGPEQALIFAIVIGTIGAAIFGVFFNTLSMILALGTIAFYAFFYTLYLKPRTGFNIVIGGAAGAMAPVIAWAAAKGGIDATPVLMSVIVFLWTPPHFWALALYSQEDYRLVDYPMMPAIIGSEATKRLIAGCVSVLIPVTWMAFLMGAGSVYITVAVLAGILFLTRAVWLTKESSNLGARRFFRYSIAYLAAIFLGLIVDKLFRPGY